MNPSASANDSALPSSPPSSSDERTLPLLTDPDHRRRQQLLISAQLERAFRLRELLTRTIQCAESATLSVPRY